ncbi:TetR/AcrR family transcriptional regulator [uncultured Desulfuromonas sp.]|mgnify:CR=1 FL=1|uniref:TetR/AcrR family transcriptional regulator n=1 Tax=uncultured Desulfuromonas sp. TaxID=181013 RepID=UPI00262A5861|nr:TetR/AcrR family transcriptional regulator [uncultured Desulfuromonas sp.]
MSEPGTKERILDAAERLFAREGFHTTSLRAITSRAGANLAAVNYHFGSKEALLEAVFERRLVPLNRERRERLEQVLEAAREQRRPPLAETALRAFIEPALRFRDSSPGARDFTTLVGRALTETEDTVRDLFIGHMEPVFILLLETLCQALPDRPKNLIFWRLRFALGAMSQAMCPATEKIPAPGIDTACETEEIIAMLIPFVSAGMETP